jgi:alpha-glucosidase
MSTQPTPTGLNTPADDRAGRVEDPLAPRPWWRTAVVYQVYIRSFADGDGDGTGDIAGLRSRLTYLRDLGVDAIWINPWYASPLADGGYDVADYFAIDDRFGTVDQAEAFIADAHEHGIRVILDLVPNHTSAEHRWFQQAVVDPTSPARQRYHFVPGKDGGPPNNWTSVFGGPAWSQVEDGMWYLHLFDPSQPDLNWGNEDVRANFLEVLRFWLDRGADGFRVDVAHGLIKHPDLPDVDSDSPLIHMIEPGEHPHWDRDEIHEIVREWRAVIDEYDDAILVAEAWVHPDRLAHYVREDEYHQSFNFSFLETPWDADALRQVIDVSMTALARVGAPNTWVLSNHDVVRHATRFGLPDPARWRAWLRDPDPVAPDRSLGQRRARAAVLLLLSLPGSAYLYQGEELGLDEVWDLDDSVRDDPVWFRSQHTDRGRDGCRVPIPWSTAGPSFGFSTAEAWLPQPARFAERAADLQIGDEQSMFELYRKTLALRREHLGDDESLEWLPSAPSVLAYRRNDLICVINLGTEVTDIPEGRILVASSPLEHGRLPGATAVWIEP